MKKYVLIVAVLLVGVAIYLAAAPYRTMAEIKTGIAQNDTAQLEANIDFQRLRDNLKLQLRQRMLSDTEEGPSDNGLAAAMASFAGWVLDASVNSLVTPDGLAALVEGKRLMEADATDAEASGNTLFNNARYSFDSFSQFSASVPNEDGEQTRFILQREGLDWKLVNIEVNVD